MAKRAKDKYYTGQLCYQNMQWWYYLCNKSFMLDPPDINLNNVLPPSVYNFSIDDINKKWYLDIKAVYQRPMKLLVEFSKQLSTGSWRLPGFACAGLHDYIPGQQYEIRRDWFNAFKYWRVDGCRLCIAITFIDPLTGFHSDGYVLQIWYKPNEITFATELYPLSGG